MFCLVARRLFLDACTLVSLDMLRQARVSRRLSGERFDIYLSTHFCLLFFNRIEKTIRECCCSILKTFEEVGVHCDRVDYHSSQPWPFPSTLMLGCMAYARTTHIKVDDNELAEARWFSREEIEQICHGRHPEGISIPPDRAIANRLINYWSRLNSNNKNNNDNNSGSKLWKSIYSRFWKLFVLFFSLSLSSMHSLIS